MNIHTFNNNWQLTKEATPSVNDTPSVDNTPLCRAELLAIIMQQRNCSIGQAAMLLNNSVYPNFRCVVNHTQHNAFLTFLTGDSYSVMAEMDK